MLETMLVALALACALAGAPPVGDRRARPDTPLHPVGVETVPTRVEVFNDYGYPSRTFWTGRLVVHWVEQGLSAPPLNDDDADGVPDYVEQVGAAGDAALAYYAHRGFAPVAPDAGGPDSLPDVYISRFAAGVFGIALPPAVAEGGAFVAVSNLLDPSDTESLGSLDGTVAHELFHLVQFSTARSQLPEWVGEGTAAAMEGRVFPRIADIVWSLQLRHWLAAPEQPLTQAGYGSAPLWRWLDVRVPRLLPGLLRSAHPSALELVRRFVALTRRSFADEFRRYAVSMYDRYADVLTPYTRLEPDASARGTVAPFAIHYLRLPLERRTALWLACDRACDATVVYERQSRYAGRAPELVRVRPERDGRTLAFRLPYEPRLTLPTLVLANGSATRPLRYTAALSRTG